MYTHIYILYILYYVYICKKKIYIYKNKKKHHPKMQLNYIINTY